MGAGAPSWERLVDKLAASASGFKDTFERHRREKVPDTMISQYIYSRFIEEAAADKTIPIEFRELTAYIKWHKKIREAIYENVSNDVAGISAGHPYIVSLAKFCIKCESTITFNFDNILDQVAVSISPQDAIPPKTTWTLPPIDKVNFPYIFHINGLLPQNERQKTSERLIFTEDSFLRVLYGSETINNNLLSRFANNTFVLVGVSLSDHSLKSILATTAARSPGSIHYIVHWLNAPDAMDEHQMDDVRKANFELYNLVTIFLTSDEIGPFLDLIQVGTDDHSRVGQDALDENFRDQINAYGLKQPVKYKYYIAGPVASGKSSLLENLRTFHTHEEWPEPTPIEMYMDHKLLSDSQRASIDQWVYRQLRIKNKRFSNAGPGVVVMDRAPLDLFAFSKNDDENQRKAEEIISEVEAETQLADGEVLLIMASPRCLLERQLGRGRIPVSKGGISYDQEGLQLQKEQLRKIYPESHMYNTDECNQVALARRAMRHILFEEYEPINLSAINRSIAKT
jgi:hypothetical protein